MFEAVIEIFTVLEYVGNGQRPYIEGTAILNGNHLMECGITNRSDDEVTILGLCLQTSSLLGKPHEIRVKISNKRITSAKCSCKAGSGKCKHIVALLLYLNSVYCVLFDLTVDTCVRQALTFPPEVVQQSLENLEDLSCTDIEQQWGRVKAQAKSMYEAAPVSTFCHVKSTTTRHPQPVSPELEDLLFNTLLNGAPDSALACHLATKDVVIENLPAESATLEPWVEDLRAYATDLIISTMDTIADSPSLDHEMLSECSEADTQFYKKNVFVTAGEAVDICLETTNQCGDRWMGYRRSRVTGSRCYELYTYSKESKVPRNWPHKLTNMFFSSFRGNIHTSYGINNEPNAIAAYMRQTSHTVSKFGLIINPNAPWLGYSPDGIVIQSKRLVDVKCLMEGRTLGGVEMAEKTSCLLVDGRSITLKQKHKYYGQVQLGMLITGLQVCDFLVYSKVLDKCVIVPVPFDSVFVQAMMSSIRKTYFKIILPFLNERETNI